MILKIKKIVKIILVLLIVVNSNKNYAQQIPNYTQYIYNMQVINPAYAGSRADLSMSLLSREQWVGVEGAPSTKTFSVNGRTFRGLGLGLTLVNDKIGLTETTNTNIDVSYTLVTGDQARLAFGLKGGITFFNNNFAQGITPDNDRYASRNGQHPNIGFGAYYYTPKFFVGLSVPYLLRTPIFQAYENFNITGISENLNYFLTGGAIFDITDKIKFKPTTIINYTTNLKPSVDINANFLLNESIETGISYRNNRSVSALFAVILYKKFRVGYSYDYNTSGFGNNLSSHEILLQFDFNFKRNSRWLLENKCFF